MTISGLTLKQAIKAAKAHGVYQIYQHLRSWYRRGVDTDFSDIANPRTKSWCVDVPEPPDAD